MAVSHPPSRLTPPAAPASRKLTLWNQLGTFVADVLYPFGAMESQELPQIIYHDGRAFLRVHSVLALRFDDSSTKYFECSCWLPGKDRIRL